MENINKEQLGNTNPDSPVDTSAENTAVENTEVNENTAAENTEANENAASESTEVNENTSAENTEVNENIAAEEKPARKKHIGLKAAIVAAIAAAALGGSYVAYAETYAQKFIDGTYINGVDVSNMTAAEVESAIKERVEQYSLELTFADGSTETIEGSSIGLEYTSDGGVEKILEEQNKYSWIQGKLMGSTIEYSVGEAYQYDEKKLQFYMESLPELLEENMTAPTNAYMVLTDANQFEIVPEDDGNTLDPNLVISAANEAVLNGVTELDVSSIENAYAAAEIRSDDENLNIQVNDLNEFLSTTITYELHDGTTNTLDGAILSQWLARSDDDENYYYIDTNALRDYCSQYLEQLAAIDDDVKTETVFHSTNKGDLTLNGEQYGYKIDQAAELEILYQDLLDRNSSTKQPTYSLNKAEGGFGDLFVEIDIDNQHVYVHQNGEIVFDSACVSGTATDPDRATPTGVFKIFWKTTDRDLKGAIDPATGQPSYVSHVNYWMPFNGGVGMHDASWRSTYGGTIYKYSGSHGCINLPYSAAQTIYNLVSVGTYVIVI